MTSDLFSRQPSRSTSTRAAPPNWKPEGCADCGLLHPTHSLNGPHGPWRCAPCHHDAKEAKRG